ncbi:MAG: histidine phosphatase family protein [Flavobacteriaceae bacterium]|nr:histidine phosphatase family protein [Bacteroidia bacterium]NNK81882.1 histidine phosphatase family protein [Flavobacteriaceae bacterium]
MKKIVFIRHGKSSWTHSLPDIQRPLKKRAYHDATLVSQRFEKENFIPDIVYSSPAIRAFTTCKLITRALDINKSDIEIVDDLYDFAGQDVIKFIQNLNNAINKIMLFGHNYAFTSLVNSLGNRYIDNLPTTGLVLIEFNSESWKNLSDGVTKLILFPKDLR